MKIIDVRPVKAHSVMFDNGEVYFRFGAYDWYQQLGESIEPVYVDDDLLEDEFQEWSKIPL